VEDGRTGRVVPVGGAEAFAAAICDVLGSRAAYRAMSSNARASAEARFRLDRVVDSYLAAYRACLEP
jgi:glycosyltransferase involved in cell wall biosynthesis